MFNVRKELAELICQDGAVLIAHKWLASEVSDLAIQIPNLDEITSQAILPLAKLVVNGVSDTGTLEDELKIDQTKLNDYLDALCEFKFAEWTGSGYEATPAGEQAVDAIGRRMVIREMFEIKRRLGHLETIVHHIDEPDLAAM